MKIITSPTVYLVGRQEFHRTQFGHFLEDQEIGHWTTDTDNAGEQLVEVAGRLCYMSFAKPRPGGNKAYIDHILIITGRSTSIAAAAATAEAICSASIKAKVVKE